MVQRDDDGSSNLHRVGIIQGFPEINRVMNGCYFGLYMVGSAYRHKCGGGCNTRSASEDVRKLPKDVFVSLYRLWRGTDGVLNVGNLSSTDKLSGGVPN